MHMAQACQVVGFCRDRGEARLAVADAMRQRLEVHAPDALVEDADGVHVILYTAVDVDYPRRLPLEYGANRVSRLARCSCCVLRDSGPDFPAVGARFTLAASTPSPLSPPSAP